MFGLIEQTLSCPNCGSSIEVQLERFYNEQEYIEDRKVCCYPINIYYRIEDDHQTEFKAESIEQ